MSLIPIWGSIEFVIIIFPKAFFFFSSPMVWRINMVFVLKPLSERVRRTVYFTMRGNDKVAEECLAHQSGLGGQLEAFYQRVGFEVFRPD
ncbi:MAG: hypothetical protein ABF544_11715 [Acetobacter orientalis]|uniref:hypothetical protein n=1 Tax=Acetobacter orientalis TaxID=146474 RepID=UPI0039ECD844